MRSTLLNRSTALLAVYFLLIVSGVSFIDAFQVLLVCSVQTWTGAFIIGRAFFRRRLNLIEQIGLGLSVGGLISVVGHLCFMRTFLSEIGWLMPSVFALVYFWVRRRQLVAGDSQVQVVSYTELLPIGVGVLAVLGLEWFWLGVPAGLLAVSQIFSNDDFFKNVATKTRKLIILVSSGLALLALTAGMLLRPFSWWIEDSDFGFFEALTVSIPNFGLNENPLATGAPIKYHWLVYGWMGVVSQAAGLPAWVMLSRAGIILGVVAIICLVWLGISYFCRDRASRLVALYLFCFFDTVSSWGSGFRLGQISSPSQLIGFLWLLSILIVLIEQQRNFIRNSHLFYPVLVAGAMLSKVNHGVVGVSGLLFVAMVELMTKKRVSRQRLLDVSLSSATVVALFSFFYFGANNATLGFLKFPAAIQGELSVYSGPLIYSASLAFLLGFAGYQLLAGTLGTVVERNFSDPVLWFCFGAFGAGLFLSLVIDVYLGAQLYFLHSGAVLLLIFAVSSIAKIIFRLSPTEKRSAKIWLLVATGFFAAFISWFLPSLNSGSKTAIALRLSKAIVVIFPIGLAVMLVFLDATRRKLVALTVFVSVGLSGLGLGFYASNWYFTMRREYSSFDRNESNNLGTPSLNQAMRWLRDSSEMDDVFASNNDGYLLSALSHRRGYLQSKYLLRRHTVFNESWERELDGRGELLTKVFTESNYESLSKLRNAQVRWLVVDKSRTDVEKFEIFDITGFENDEYLVLDLALLG